MKKLTFVLAAFLIAVSATAGDMLVLKNELLFEGKVIKIRNCQIVFKVDGEKYFIPASEIAAIYFEHENSKVYKEFLEQEVAPDEACMNGRVDAQKFHGKRGVHMILGFLFGPFSMLGTALSKPTPEKGQQTLAMSPNKDQFTDPNYLKCYKKSAKKALVGDEAYGWLLAILVLTLVSL